MPRISGKLAGCRIWVPISGIKLCHESGELIYCHALSAQAVTGELHIRVAKGKTQRQTMICGNVQKFLGWAA